VDTVSQTVNHTQTVHGIDKPRLAAREIDYFVYLCSVKNIGNMIQMRFDIDNQTTNDLELFEKTKGNKSVFSLFNYTKSVGGKKRLETMFANPFTEMNLIKQRIEIIKGFQDNDNDNDFEIDKECLDFIEYYLLQQNIPNHYSILDSYLKTIRYKIKPKNEYYIVQRGIRYLIVLLNEIYDYSINSEQKKTSDFLSNCRLIIRDNIENTSIKVIIGLKKRKKLYPYEFGKLDYLFRKSELNNVKDLLDIIYEIDVYRSIAFAANKHGLTLPTFTNKPNCFYAQRLFHPFLDNPVANDLEFLADRNICFLTGPNMAGKSTFLKAISISIYLAHLGFPVPAKSMETSVFNGLLTTINLSDNINKSYSHFYNEVLRVKYIAERINQVGSIFVVFDELFRGTNVKDAYEASLSVISAFSKLNKSVFAISTHIIEIADKLNDNASLFFKYFEANLVNDAPQYNYKIKDGVTDERIGMYILKKEKVIETIENSIE
jgi:DNA mismatch repair ATPase MutS